MQIKLIELVLVHMRSFLVETLTIYLIFYRNIVIDAQNISFKVQGMDWILQLLILNVTLRYQRNGCLKNAIIMITIKHPLVHILK